VLSIPIYEPGRPIEEIARLYGLKKVIKLASNENPIGPSTKALAVISKAKNGINRYPDGSGFYLKNAIARHYRIKRSRVILGNGTNEILHMLTLAFVDRGDEVIFGSPSFVVYEMESLIQEARIKKIALSDFQYDLKKILSAITRRTSLIVIANPNNPTGTFVAENELTDFMEGIPPHVLIVFDEAYAEYAPQDIFPDTLKYINQNRNVITVRTFSKIYGLAGLRIGYGIARESIVKAMEHVRQPFNTNTLAQEAAIAALDDRRHLEKSFRLNQEGLTYLEGEFERLGLKYVPSGANFILIHINKSANEIFRRLLREGVIVRPFTGSLSQYLRITVGLPQENKIFIKKLEKCLGKKQK
jgi:histidinol-phosphate aminotransferase